MSRLLTTVWNHRVLGVISLLLLSLSVSPLVQAANTDCAFSVSPSSVTPGSDNYAVFTISNTSNTAISNIKIVSPNDQVFTVISNSAYQWQSSNTSNTAFFYSGNLNPNQTLNFTVEFIAGGSPTAALNWTVQTTDDPNSTSYTTCAGDGGVAIASQPSVIAITNVSVVAISPQEVTIVWTTDVPATSAIQYGRTSDYDTTTTTDAALTTDHEVTIKNLRPTTVYHYTVISTTSDGGTASQGDNTFLTAVQQKTVAPIFTIIGTPAETKPSPVAIKAVPIEKIAPTVSLTARPPRIVNTMPRITGVGDDNEALARIEYSLNNGKSWQAVDTTKGLGTSRVSFSFQPSTTLEGNYTITVRAIDTSGNIGTLASGLDLVLDRLPPIFSNFVVTFGSQSIQADDGSQIDLAVGNNYKITGQAVGGATAINIIARDVNGKTQTFSLGQDNRSGLWSGAMSLTKNGAYRLSVKAVDGADNRTDRQLGRVAVQSTGKVTNKSQQALQKATITVYYFEPSTHRWVIWDGQPYGQQNPQPVVRGNYRLMIPAGKYYLKATANGYGTVITQRFIVKQAQSINQSFELPHHALVTIGKHAVTLPSWPKVIKVSLSGRSAITADKLVGSSLPIFTLPTLAGGTAQKLDFFGRPTDMVLLDTWSPSSIDQLPALAATQRNRDVGIVPVFEGQSVATTNAYLQLATLNLAGLADPDSNLAESLHAGFGPRHIFFDRSGHIKKVMVGVLSEEEILQELGGL